MKMGCFPAIVTAFCWSLTAVGQEPGWESMNWTRHDLLQAVNSSGTGTFAATSPVKSRGVILNWSRDMLDGECGANPYMGGQWQRYIQAVDLPDTSADDSDFGGTACWMGQNIGKIVGNHPAGSYTDEAWLAELDRLNHDPLTGARLRPGDLVEIRARAPGFFYNGKLNINEQHSNNPLADFDLVLLQPDYGLPTPQVVTLPSLKDASNDFIFDVSRATGPEHYQGSAVQIDNITFVDTTSWGPNSQMTIIDGTGRTLPVLLGLGSGFAWYPPPNPPFSIVGILDQEDDNAEDGYKQGYRLWVMDYDGTEFLLVRYARADFDQDGDVDADDASHFETCATGPEIEQTDPACIDADLDRDSDVDQTDFGVWQRCFSGTDVLADPVCAD